MERLTDTPVTISGLTFEAPIMNAAGTCKTPEEAVAIVASDSAAVMVGSITADGKSGNAGRTYYRANRFVAANSIGLKNEGAEYYQAYMPTFARIAHDAGKPLLVNSSGESPEENAYLMSLAFNGGADGGEVNIACPNVWGPDGQQKRIAGFVLELIEANLGAVEKEVGFDAWIALKLPPYSDPYFRLEVAKLLAKSRLVKAITLCNTFPNVLVFDETGERAITPGGGLAGMSGPAMKPIALGHVAEFRPILRPDQAIIGVGGIENAQDVKEYLVAGAQMTAINTAQRTYGNKVFSDARERYK